MPITTRWSTQAAALAEYYAASGTAPGRWYGNGLKGLAGAIKPGDLVTPEAMTRLSRDGSDPTSCESLGVPFDAQQGGTGKAILKKAMERYLPHDILYRPKMGFVTPVSHWFRGPLVEQAKALATSSTLTRSGWFDMAEIERIVAAHQSGRRDHGRLIWQFFMLEKSLAKLFGI